MRYILASRRKRLLVSLFDLALFAVAYAGAYLIRVDLQPYRSAWAHFDETVVTVLLVKVLVFVAAGTYRRLMLHASIPDVLVLARTATFASLAVFLALKVLPGAGPYSRGVLVVDWLLTVALLAAARVAWRMYREGYLGKTQPTRSARKRVLIVGAGKAGVSLAKELLTHRDVEVIGFVDDDPEKQGATLLGRPVLGTTEDLPEIPRCRPVDQVIVAIASATPSVLKRIAGLAQGVRDFRVIPSLDALLRGTASIVQAVPIPEETFLARNVVDMAAAEATRFFEGKTVLVTGAGGSIGSELARQLGRREHGKVGRLLLLDSAETPLYDVHRQVAPCLGGRAVRVLASVRDHRRMAEVLEAERPDVILHAAALKHVPLCEEHPLEAMATNTWATARLADLARRAGVAHFTLVSTDKAVAPSCVMGASKRAAETYVRSLAEESATRFAVVRFGNVLGSNGSVLPLFHEQISHGGPVTVTDPRATRFFMTIPEACGLILQATRIAQGGEVYVLDMGEPVRVLDLAHNLIRLYGYVPGRDIEVKVIGLRPGEKLHESLVDDAEEAELLPGTKLLRIRSPRAGRRRCRELIDALAERVERRDEGGALRILGELVPTMRVPGGDETEAAPEWAVPVAP